MPSLHLAERMFLTQQSLQPSTYWLHSLFVFPLQCPKYRKENPLQMYKKTQVK